jgi:phenylacetate-CoA ligase
MMETGAQALGCTVFAGGTGQTEQQVQAMADLRPAAYVGTPSFLKIIVEKAQEMGVKLPSLTKAMVSGEAFRPRSANGCASMASTPTRAMARPIWA